MIALTTLSRNGAYRFFPGQHTADCTFFDPRNRPWYIAASTGPKNIVLLLDVSGSMDNGEKLSLMKRAAKRVVNTLSVGDRVALVPFSDTPSTIADEVNGKSVLFKASDENKALLNEMIDSLDAVGSTNFLDTFRVTFELLASSYEIERTVNCNTAILFLTDGIMTTPQDVTEDDVMQLVSEGINELKQTIGHSVILFTYSISDDELVHQFPKNLACSTGTGVWSLINDENEILESLKSYSDLFALGLGSGANEEFATFVEPYLFFDVEGVPGVTVSTPVYDKSKTPHLFLGVVGVDILVAALDRALNVPIGSPLTLELLEMESTAKCPVIDLTQCELESFRRRGISRTNEDAICTNNCTSSEFVQIEEQECPIASDLPTYLWTDNGGLGRTAEERLCCNAESLGEPAPESCFGEQPATSSRMLVIVLSTLALVLVVVLFAILRNRNSPGASKVLATGSVIPMAPPPVNPDFIPSAVPIPASVVDESWSGPRMSM